MAVRFANLTRFRKRPDLLVRAFLKRWLARRPDRFDALVRSALQPHASDQRIRELAAIAVGLRPAGVLRRAYANAFLDNVGLASVREHEARRLSIDLGPASVGFRDVKVECRSGYGYTATVYLQGLDDLVMFDLFETVLSRGDAVADVGANEGIHACVLGRCVEPDGRVWAYEPVPANVTRFETNLALNRLSNVTVRPVGVADEPGMLPFAFTSPTAHNTGMSRFDPAASTTIPVVRLDDEFSDARPVRLIKIDVEGVEPKVVKGAHRILEQHEPFLVVEYNRTVWCLGELRSLIPFEHDVYLKPERLGVKWTPLEGTGDHRELPESTDVLVVPRSRRARVASRLG